LKTTQRILVGWIAVAMSISAGLASAGLPQGLAVAWLSGAVLGQQGGSIFSGFSSSPAVPPNDPFASRGATSASGGDTSGVTRLPPTGQVPPAGYGYPGGAAPQAMPAGNRAHSDALLRQARLALAVQDVRRASDFVAQARREQVRYAANEDNPDRVDLAISTFQEVSRLDRSSEENRKRYARMLMEQSEALLQWSELEQADKLASLAAEQRAAYGPFDAKPQDLLRRIEAQRQQMNPAGPRQIDRRLDGPNAVGPSLAGRQQATELMRQIRRAMAANQIPQAEMLCRQLDALRIPENAFAPGEDTPGRVFQDVRQAMARNPSGVIPAAGIADPNSMVQRADYDPSRDPTRNMQVAAEQPLEAVPSPSNQPGDPATAGQSPGYSLFQQGEAALKARDTARALDCFRRASTYSADLDPTTAARLQDHLSLLSVPRNTTPRAAAGPADEAAAAQSAFVRQIYSDVTRSEADARRLLETDPKVALSMLQETRKKVEIAGLDPATRDQFLRRLDRSIADTEHYIDQNRSRIEWKDHNDSVRRDMSLETNAKLQTQQKLAELVDQYNRLNEEQRFEEAEVIAKRAYELAPHEMVTQVMVSKSSILIKYNREKQIRERQQDGFANAMMDVDEAAIATRGDFLFPDAKNWRSMTNRRAARNAELNRRHRSEKEIDIEKKLLTPVRYTCRNRPLSEVLSQLAKVVDVNIHLDEEGLREEGQSPDTPVTLELASDIQLKSYLNLILEKYHLCYIIKNEVLNITSETKKLDHVYQQVYPVGDLVMPIPNFVASPRMGLAGALHDAMGDAVGTSSGLGTMMTPNTVVASKSGQQNNAVINPAIMANMAPRLPGATGNQPGAMGGPGGAGNGSSADFDTLIDLITQTVAPATWDHNGGKGNIAASPTNLSLVVSQTQEVHEQIVDLLEQLRRMQDLQVTIEVRFITLSDSFFERIGVDFDFNIVKNVSNPTAAGFSVNPATGLQQYTPGTSNGTSIPGLIGAPSNNNPPTTSGLFTTDLSIPFSQGNYALAVPQFGGFDATAGASVGFAILSDIEAYFFINAAQGDRRTNVLQAPKVTLFNGQQAFVSDTSQTPFVISVIPVVGDFAAAQQPVIVVLSEGTFMTVQAVVSNDRRFVRLTIVPFFSKIGNVQTFTFQGTDSTTTDSTQNGIVDQANKLFNNNSNHVTTSHSGVTVQLPTFSFVTVTTTVSVPDGGTVLLGGIKRLSEGRNEFGVPILDKVPYLDRLFKNVGIGRDTSSLMMMVTPRIIIQEEEEDKMGVNTTAP
jgi:general secretion pathway protein D